MSLRDTLIECGIEAERADAMLARLEDGDEGVAHNALQEICRALTPVLVHTLREILADERRKGGAP